MAWLKMPRLLILQVGLADVVVYNQSNGIVLRLATSCYRYRGMSDT